MTKSLPKTRTYMDYVIKAEWEAQIARRHITEGEYNEARKAMARCQVASIEAQRRLRRTVMEQLLHG